LARRLARWLLQLDRPVPEQSDAELAAYTQRHFRWNFAVNLADGVFFWFGLSFFSASTIVPLFISKLTNSTIPIGVAAMIAQSGWYLPQILSANWVEQLPRRKPFVVSLGLLLERFPVLLLFVAALLAGRSPGAALGLFLLAYAWRSLGSGVVGTAWQDLIARVIPLERRGFFWGLTSALGTGAGVLGSMASAWILRTYAFPTSFAYLFGVAAALMLLSWLAMAQSREAVQPIQEPRQNQHQFLVSLPGLVRQDPPFRRFLVARVLLALGMMGMGFVTVSAVQRWGVSDGVVGIYTAALLLGQTAGNLVFGLRADRHGHKSSLEWAGLCFFAAFALAWLAPAPGCYYLVFFLLGAGTGSVFVSGILVVFEFSRPAKRPTYVGLANSIVGLANLGGPLLATWLAGRRIDYVFAFSAALSLAAWGAMRWWVQEPRWASNPTTAE